MSKYAFTSFNPYMTTSTEKVAHHWAWTLAGTWTRQAHEDNILYKGVIGTVNEIYGDKHEVTRAINSILLNGSHQEFYEFLKNPEVLKYFPNPVKTTEKFLKKGLEPMRYMFDHMIQPKDRPVVARHFITNHMYDREWMGMSRGKIYKE